MPLYTYEFKDQEDKRIDLVRTQEDRNNLPTEDEIKSYLKTSNHLKWEDGMEDKANWQKIITSPSNRWYYCDDISTKYR